jgi:hypothetical protein
MRIKFKIVRDTCALHTDILNISYHVFITIIAIKSFYDFHKLSLNAVIIKYLTQKAIRMTVRLKNRTQS